MAWSSTRQELFERSNVFRGGWEHFSALLDAILDEQRVSEESVLGISMVELFRKPDGSSMGSDTMLLAVFPDSISLAREKRSLFSKSIETRVLFLRELGHLVADEREWSNGQGDFAVQVLNTTGSPAFRLGWDWTYGGTEPRTRDTARQERDHILGVVQSYLSGAGSR